MLRPIFFLAFFIALVFGANPISAQSFDWVRGGGSMHPIPSGTAREAVYEMCTDYNGNVYALSSIGHIGPIIADTFYRASAYGSDENLLLTSHTCDGQMRFAKLISATSCENYGLASDSTGHIYIAMMAFHGSVSSSTFLRIGYDTTITGATNQTQMLIQYDTSGHLGWVRFVGDNTTATLMGTLSYGSNLAVDGDNNVHFINTMRYGVPITPTLTSHWGTYDLKYNSIGTLLSVKKLQIDSSLILVDGVCINKSNNKLYVYGSRLNGMFPDSSRYPYVAAYDTDRNLVWIDTLESATLGGGFPAFSGIVSDNAAHIYLTGARAGSLGYRGDTVYSVLSGALSFVMKLDTNGQAGWIRGFSNTLSVNNLLQPCITPNGNVVAGGTITGTMVSGTDTMIVYSGEGQNSHFVIIDTAGFIDVHQQLHGWGFNDGINCAVSDRIGNIHVGGEIQTNTWAGSLTPYTSIGGNSDYFIMKYGVDCDCIAMPIASYTDTGYLVHGFTYTGTTTPIIDSVRWDFGDGTTSTLLNPIHTYATADTFSACVRVYTPCGSDLYCKEIRIPCITAPVPAFAMSGTGLTRTFTYTGTATGVSSLSWTFTDGGVAAGSPVNHTFSAAATYTACVTAVNTCGSTTTCNPITVTCTATPVSAYTVSGAGLTKIFNYTGTTAGLDSVRWTFGDGGIATGLTPGHAYAAAGTYTVCATVYTNCGSHTYCSPIVVTCITSPVASFSSSGSGLTHTFTYSGTTSGMDSVRWNFGDGIASTVLSPIHTFSAAGTYTVCVTVYTNCGSNTYCTPITVTCLVPPIASFTFSGTGAAKTFTYTGTTTGMDSVRWNFGDGGTSTLLSPTHTFSTEDTFNVCVRVYTNCGSHISCQDVIATCFSPVVSAFTDTGSLVHGFAYTGTMPGYDSVVWDYGDGNTDTGLITIHTYAVADTYNVCAKVYTDCGTHTYCRNIIVLVATSVSSISAANIQVYPNPSAAELYITGIAQKTDYRILNVVGVSLQQGILTNGSNTISIQNIPTGMYLLELVGVDGTRNVVRIVKM